MNSDSGLLSFKDAFQFTQPTGSTLPWCKLIWKRSIPLPNPLFFGILRTTRCPQDNLWARGCITVSVCSLCGQAAKTINHLFLHCLFKTHLWRWLGELINATIDCSDFHTLLAVCAQGLSLQVLYLVTVGLVNILWCIWHCKNKCRFDNKHFSIRAAINFNHCKYFSVWAL